MKKRKTKLMPRQPKLLVAMMVVKGHTVAVREVRETHGRITSLLGRRQESFSQISCKVGTFCNHERNMIQTAIRGDFSLGRVAQEFRNRWTEEDVRRRDGLAKNTGYLSHERKVESESEPETSNLTASALREEGMNDEGIFLVEKAETEAQEAYTVLQQAKRTLKEARAKQRQVKMSRQYYYYIVFLSSFFPLHSPVLMWNYTQHEYQGFNLGLRVLR